MSGFRIVTPGTGSIDWDSGDGNKSGQIVGLLLTDVELSQMEMSEGQTIFHISKACFWLVLRLIKSESAYFSWIFSLAIVIIA